MVTLRYKFNDEDFDYDVARSDVEKALYDWLLENWTHEELIEYIIDTDGSQVDLLLDFKEEIHDLFESEAEEHYYDEKHSDYGVSDEDFL